MNLYMTMYSELEGLCEITNFCRGLLLSWGTVHYGFLLELSELVVGELCWQDIFLLELGELM